MDPHTQKADSQPPAGPLAPIPPATGEEARWGPGGRWVGWAVFDLLVRRFFLINAVVGGALIGAGLEMKTESAVRAAAFGGATIGAVVGLAMWGTGPGRRIASFVTWVLGSAFLFLLWWLLALGTFAAIQLVLDLATGGWETTSWGAWIGGGIGYLVGVSLQKIGSRRLPREQDPSLGG